MLALALMLVLFLITLSVIGQLVSGSADLTPAGLGRSVVRGFHAVAQAGDVVRPGASSGR